MAWEEVKLGDVVTLRQGFALNSKSKHYLSEKDIGIPLFKISDLLNNIETLFVKKEIPKQFLVFEDEIIYSRTGQVGYAFMGKKGVIYNNCFKVIPDENRINKIFLYKVLNTDSIRKYAQTLATGTAQLDLNHDAFKSIIITIPSLSEQQKIVNLISNYDNLIENNNKKIKLLEEMAEEIYKEWFVRLRFPNYQNTKIVDGIPDGWEDSTLSQECNINMGQSPKSSFYNENNEGLPFHQGVSNYGFRFPQNEIWTTEENRIAERGDILFSVRAPVGRLNIASEKIVIGRGLSSISHKNGMNSYLYYSLKNMFFKDNVIGSGAIFESVTKSDVENIKILKVNNVIKKFNDFVISIDLKIEKLILKNQNLKQTRDLLLPRLISGKLNIEDLDIK